MKIKRFGVSLEEDLLDSLDELVRKKQFPNRSQAIRHLVREQLIKQRYMENENVAGAIVLVYDHHKRDLNNRSIKLQHRYEHLVLSVQHVHLDHDLCLESIAVRGKARDLVDLADKLIAIKGMKHGRLVMTVLE